MSLPDYTHHPDAASTAKHVSVGSSGSEPSAPMAASAASPSASGSGAIPTHAKSLARDNIIRQK